MEYFVGPNSTCRRGLVKAFVVIGHDRSLSEHEIRMMAGVIVPGEAPRVCGGLGRKGGLQSKRLAGRQMGQDKMQLAGGAGCESGASPLCWDGFAVRPGKDDGGNPFVVDVAARHLNSHGDIGAFVPPCANGELKRRGISQGRGGSREVKCNGSKG